MSDDIESTTYLGHAIDRPSDGENAFVNALYYLANTGFHASLLPEFCNIFSTLSDDYARLFCADKRAES
jgi:hypothetical protein